LSACALSKEARWKLSVWKGEPEVNRPLSPEAEFQLTFNAHCSRAPVDGNARTCYLHDVATHYCAQLLCRNFTFHFKDVYFEVHKVVRPFIASRLLSEAVAACPFATAVSVQNVLKPTVVADAAILVRQQ
jgi:hypothetical protein